MSDSVSNSFTPWVGEYPKMSRTLGVVVPAYQPDVEALVSYISDLLAELEPETLRVELDAPQDKTLAALEATDATINAVDVRRGKGAAITAGFDALETDVLAFADADGSTPATSVADVVAPVLDGATDLAVGSRRHPDATVRSHQTILRQHLGDVFAWLGRRFLPVELRDYQCGAKAIGRETWQSIRPSISERGFAWDVEVLGVAAALGHSITEVPVIWEDHPDSTVETTRAVPELLRALFDVRRRIKAGENELTTPANTKSRPDGDPLVERDP